MASAQHDMGYSRFGKHRHGVCIPRPNKDPRPPAQQSDQIRICQKYDEWPQFGPSVGE